MSFRQRVILASIAALATVAAAAIAKSPDLLALFSGAAERVQPATPSAEPTGRPAVATVEQNIDGDCNFQAVKAVGNVQRIDCSP